GGRGWRGRDAGGGAEGKPDAVQAERTVAAHPLQGRQGRPSAHVILRMDLEETDGGGRGRDRRQMRPAQADSGWRGQRHGPLPPPLAAPDGWGVPPAVLAQVPAGT